VWYPRAELKVHGINGLPPPEGISHRNEQGWENFQKGGNFNKGQVTVQRAFHFFKCPPNSHTKGSQLRSLCKYNFSFTKVGVAKAFCFFLFLVILYSTGRHEASFHPSVSSSIRPSVPSIHLVMVCLLRQGGERVEYRCGAAENNIY
jgi:hypothetical protein